MPTEVGIDVLKAANILRSGGLVAIPTETVYGLATNGLDHLALARIFEAKQRPTFDPIILHIHSVDDVNQLVLSFPEKARKIAEKYWPGPLTLVLPKSDIVPDIVSAGLPTVGLRIPHHPLTLKLLREVHFPLAAPSANPFGYVSPTSAQHVKNQLDGKIDYILDGGLCRVGLESSILSFAEHEPTLLRLGGLDVQDIEAITGPLSQRLHKNSNPTAPGMLDVHYAPRKKFVVGAIPKLLLKYDGNRVAVLGFSSTYGMKGIVLSKSGSLTEAAHNLFAAMRTLDELPDCDIILAEKVPTTGLGLAINDRLGRAAAKNQ